MYSLASVGRQTNN